MRLNKIRIYSFLLALLCILPLANTQAQTLAVPHFGRPIVPRALIPGAGIVGGGYLGYRAYRNTQNAHADIGMAVHSAVLAYGGSDWNSALSMLREAISQHPIVGRNAAMSALKDEARTGNNGAIRAQAVASEIGLQMPAVGNGTAARTQAANPAVDKTDKECKEDDNSPLRSRPGIATGGENLPYITTAERPRWWFGTNGNLALIPRQVADRLRGKPFAGFDRLREAIWKEIGNDSILNREFDIRSKGLMLAGKAPFAPNNGSIGGNGRYQIHHKNPINQGGDVYNFNNLVIVTPMYHGSLLEERYHYGR